MPDRIPTAPARNSPDTRLAARQQSRPHTAPTYAFQGVSSNVALRDEEVLDGLLGVAYSQRRWSEALNHADQLLEILPGSVRVHAIRGDALVQLGQRQTGIEAVERAREFNPGAEPLYEWLIEQYAALRQDRKVEQLTRQLERIRNAKPITDVKDED